jgi:hypothetical protein
MEIKYRTHRRREFGAVTLHNEIKHFFYDSTHRDGILAGAELDDLMNTLSDKFLRQFVCR